MASDSFEIKPLSGSVGAELLGLDLARDLSQETFEAIHRAFLDHQVIFFRDQELTVDQQIEFARRFGPLLVDPFIKSADERAELMEVVREKHEARAFGENWHSDNTYLEKPPLASFLYAKEVPPYGGDTVFSNQYLAYESLSPGMRAFIDGLRARHAPWGYHNAIGLGQFKNGGMKLRGEDVVNEALKIEALHPVVRTHPETGRKALYVNRAYTIRFEDWTEAESRPVLDYLLTHAIRTEFTCRFRWAAKSLAVWDNRCLLHQAINDVHGFRRAMNRVVAEGDRPY
ncbi:MAG: taurine dioxygenase [Alphaproteobacteria bacterium]|nr:taurine dioxygenase [Alphaproteobacteria bacterium]